MRILFVILAVLLVVPGWAGEERGARVTRELRIVTSRVPLDASDVTREIVGGLRYLGGISLDGNARSFGGFSALVIRGDQFTLLSDGGLVLRFTLGADWRLRQTRWHALPGGPRTGWERRDRDSESLVVDPAADRAWIGFESANAIWRYSADLARVDAFVVPRAMRDWRSNGGSESLVRLADGRFVAIAETSRVAARDWRGSEEARRRTREMLIFPRDPLAGGVVRRAAYVRTPGYHVVDAVAAPEGDLIVLERAFRLPYRFTNRVMRVAARDVASGKVIRGRAIAALEPPLIHDNFEGMAVTREKGATILWLVSDDNQSMLQRTLLLKFALIAPR